MSVPLPSTPISGHCAAIDGDNLYVYDENKFQSLPLKRNATWSEQSYGQSVINPACVKAIPNGDESNAALYVIGGDTDDAEYLGLQRYFFGNDSWETLNPPAGVLQTRTNHSVAYLNDSQSILVYGGSPSDEPSVLSSQTFLISTVPPYVIDSFTSNAPPTNNAILTPWNSSHALMVGGTQTNTDVWLFGPDDGWSQFPTTLSEPLDGASRGIIVDGDDGSKVLQVYNFHVSPNTAQGIVLLDSNEMAAASGVTVGNNTGSAQRKRDLTLNDWPSYNSSNAPTTTRQDCSISRSSDGLVVMAGGNEDDPVILFNQNDNSWVNASSFFDSKQQQPLLPSATSAPTSTARPTEPAPTSTESTPPILANGSAHDRTMRTLGITLGTLCGIAAVFILILLYLRWRKLKAKKANGGYLEEKDGDGRQERMSFQDRGASFMKEAGVSNTDLPPPNNPYGAQHNSHSSLAIIAGRFGNNKRYTGAHHSAKGSFESTTHLVKDREGNLVPGENLEMMDIGDKTRQTSMLAVPGAVAQGSALDKETIAERKRSSGWSRYFATSAEASTNGLSHIPSVYVKPNTLSVGSQYSGDDRTPSSGSRIPSSALVPPLDIDFEKTVDGQRLSHVAQGSPIVSAPREVTERGDSIDIPDPQKAVIVDPADPRKSQATSISSYGNRSTLGSTVSSDFYETQVPWSPMSGAVNFKTHMNERPTSSVYTNSLYDSKERRPSRGKGAGFFPGAGTNYRPNKVKMSHAAGPSSDWASPIVMPAAKAEQNRDSAASNITVFPGMKDFESTPPKKKENKQSEPEQATSGAPSRPESNLNADMSWLNLGLNKNQQ